MYVMRKQGLAKIIFPREKKIMKLTLKCHDKFLAFVAVEFYLTFSVPFLIIKYFVFVTIPVA